MKEPVVLGFRVLHITCALCWALLSQKREVYMCPTHMKAVVESGDRWIGRSSSRSTKALLVGSSFNLQLIEGIHIVGVRKHRVHNNSTTTFNNSSSLQLPPAASIPLTLPRPAHLPSSSSSSNYSPRVSQFSPVFLLRPAKPMPMV
jgi:hypothetical protein